MTYYYSNTAQPTTLAVAVNAAATTFNLTAISGFPSTFPYRLVIDGANLSAEVVDVTGLSGTSATVTRGRDGTTAVSHGIGAAVSHDHVAGDFTNFWDHANNTSAHGVNGVIVGTAGAQDLTSKTLLAANAGTVAAIVKGAPSQTADLLSVRNNSNTVLVGIDFTGAVTVSADVTAQSAHLLAGTNSQIPFTITQKSGSTQSLLVVNDPLGSPLLTVGAFGVITGGQFVAAPVAIGDVALQVQRVAGGTADLVKVKGSAGNDYLNVTTDGTLNVFGHFTASRVFATQAETDFVPLIAQAMAGSTASLVSLRDNSGTEVVRVDPDGSIGSHATTGGVGRNTAPYAKLTISADQFVGSVAGLTAVNFDTDTASTTDAGMVNLGGNRLICTHDGTHMVTAQIGWEIRHEDLGRYACIMLNGTTRIAAAKKSGMEGYPGAGGDQQNLSAVMRLVAGDYVQAFVDHDSASGLRLQNIVNAADNSLAMGWLAP